MWKSKEYPYLPYIDLPYGRIEGERKGREESTMSIAIGLVGTDGIVVATDSRSVDVARDVYHNDVKKLWRLDNGWYLTMCCDFIKLGRVLVDTIKNQFKDDITTGTCESSIMNIQQKLSEALKGFIDSYPLNLVNQGLLRQINSKFLLVGYANGFPKIVELCTDYYGPSFLPTYFACHVHGDSDVAQHLLRQFKSHLYKNEDGDYSPTQDTNVLKNIATMIIIEASDSNKVYINDRIQMAIIKPGYIKEMKPIDLDNLKDKIRKELSINRDSLFQRIKDIE